MQTDKTREQQRPITDTVAFEPSETASAGARAGDVHADRVVLGISLPERHQRIRERAEAIMILTLKREICVD